MFKIHSLQNKESLIIIAMGAGLVLMTIVTIANLVPVLLEVYAPDKKSAGQSPIDTETVNKALDYLNEDK